MIRGMDGCEIFLDICIFILAFVFLLRALVSFHRNRILDAASDAFLGAFLLMWSIQDFLKPKYLVIFILSFVFFLAALVSVRGNRIHDVGVTLALYGSFFLTWGVVELDNLSYRVRLIVLLTWCAVGFVAWLFVNKRMTGRWFNWLVLPSNNKNRSPKSFEDGAAHKNQ
jgi:hypothetical protein